MNRKGSALVVVLIVLVVLVIFIGFWFYHARIASSPATSPLVTQTTQSTSTLTQLPFTTHSPYLFVVETQPPAGPINNAHLEIYDAQANHLNQMEMYDSTGAITSEASRVLSEIPTEPFRLNWQTVNGGLTEIPAAVTAVVGKNMTSTVFSVSPDGNSIVFYVIQNDCIKRAY